MKRYNQKLKHDEKEVGDDLSVCALDETCYRMKCVSAVVKIYSRKFKSSFLTLTLPENKLLHKCQILVIYFQIFNVKTFLKKCFIRDIFCNS